MNKHIGEIVLFMNSSQGIYLMKIESQERKKCKGDFFRKTYFSGRAYLLDKIIKAYEDPNSGAQILQDLSTYVSNIEPNNVEFLNEFTDKHGIKYSEKEMNEINFAFSRMFD